MLDRIFKYLLIIISILLEIIIQILMSGQAVAGDHVDYKNYFDFISLSNFKDFLDTDSAGFIGSYDYLYNFIVYIFSRFADFHFFTFIINLLYYFVFLVLFLRMKMVYVLPFIPFTFYVIGLQFSAQRLILAIAIFSLTYLYAKMFFSFLSLFVHVQIAPLFLIFNKKIKPLIIIIVLSILTSLAYFFDVTAAQKLLLYAANRNEIKFADYLFLFYIYITIIVSCKMSDLKYLILPFSIFGILILLIGDGRINVIIYIFSLLFLQNIINISLYSKILYFIFLSYDFIKGFQFIGGIINGNSGFDSININ